MTATSPSTSPCPDVEAALAQAESLGGSRMMGPEEIMGRMILGMFKDPEGHVIGLINPVG